MEGILEIKLDYGNGRNSLKTISFPKWLNKVRQVFGSFTIVESGGYYESISPDTIWLNRSGNEGTSNYDISNKIEDIKESFSLLAKEYDIEVKLHVNGVKNITCGEIWICEKSEFIKNKKESEAKMTKGIEGKIVVKQAYINEETESVNTRTIYGSSVQEINPDERFTIVYNEKIENVYYASVDGNLEIDTNKPILEKLDTRQAYCINCGARERVTLEFDTNLITKNQRDMKMAEINEELACLSPEIEYKLIWE